MQMTYDKAKKTFTLTLTHDEHLIFGATTNYPAFYARNFEQFRLVRDPHDPNGHYLLPVEEVAADMRPLRDALMNVATDALTRYLRVRDVFLERSDMLSWPEFCQTNWPGFDFDLPDHRRKNMYGEKPKQVAA